MDGLGYRNWGNKSNAYDDDQSDTSPPAYGSDSYGFSAEVSPRAGQRNSSKAKTSANVYDYSIEGDDDSFRSSPGPVRKIKVEIARSSFSSAAAVSSQPARRKTTEERMREILERNDADKKAAKIENAVHETETNTWKSSWDDLLEGMNTPEASRHEDESYIETPSLNAQKSTGIKGDQSPSDSSYGDFEISASDLEVGTMAAKRAFEKTSDRIRRAALEEAQLKSPPTKSRPAKASESPDIVKRNDPQPGVKMSMAISAIYKNSNRDGDVVSSADNSKGDNDIYSILKKAKSTGDIRGAGKGPSDSRPEQGQRRSADSDFSLARSSVTADSKGTDLSDDFERSGEGGDEEDEEEEGAEYSSDDFDHSSEVKINNPPHQRSESPADAAVKEKEGEIREERERVAEKGKAKEEVWEKKEEKLSEEEIDRRKSFELIKQRWLNPPEVPPPIRLKPVEEVVVEESSAESGRGGRESGDEGSRDGSPRIPEQDNDDEEDDDDTQAENDDDDDDGDDGEETRDDDNSRVDREDDDDGDDDDETKRQDDAEERDNKMKVAHAPAHRDIDSDNDGDNDRDIRAEKNNTSMISRHKEDQDGDRVLDSVNYPASSRYEYSDSNTNTNTDSHSNSHSMSHSHKSMETPSAFSQSNDELIGTRLLTTVGSSSMVSSVPPPFASSVPPSLSDTGRLTPSPYTFYTSDMPHGNGPNAEEGEGIGCRIGTSTGGWLGATPAVGVGGSGEYRNPAASDDDLAGMLNRRSVAFDLPLESNKSGTYGPRTGPETGTGGGGGIRMADQGQLHPTPYIETVADESEEETSHQDEGFTEPSYLNRHEFSHSDPPAVRMFRPYDPRERSYPIQVADKDTGADTSRSVTRTLQSNTNRSFPAQEHVHLGGGQYVHPRGSASQGSSSAYVRSPDRACNKPLVPPFNRSHELPISAPTRDELYAQLAMISSAADRRAALVNVKAKATQSKGKDKRRENERERIIAKNVILSHTPHNEPALNRLEQGTARLTRQFESLQREIANMSLRGSKRDDSTSSVREEGWLNSRPRSMIPFRSGSNLRMSQGSGERRDGNRSNGVDTSRNTRGGRAEGVPSRDRKSRDLGLRATRTGAGHRGRSDRDSSPAEDDLEFEEFDEEYDGDHAADRSRHERDGDVKGRVRGRADKERLNGDHEFDSLSGPYAESRWGLRAMETIQKIVDSGVTLGNRASELNHREEELRIRESLTASLAQDGFGQTVTKKENETLSEKNRFLLEENEKLKRLILQRDEHSKQHEKELLGMIVTLKAQLFQVTSERDDALERVQDLLELKGQKVAGSGSGSRAGVSEEGQMGGLANDKDAGKDGEVQGAGIGQGNDRRVELSSQPAHFKSSAIAPTIITRDGKNDEERVTILRCELDALQAECASQEILITGFQRENEKLMKGARTLDLESASARSKFFDQREYLNKEVNRLRNLVGETAHDSDREKSRGMVDMSRGQGGGVGSDPFDPDSDLREDTYTSSYPSSSPSPSPYSRKSADVLRAELDRDALVRHLRERAATAEAGAGVREKDLQLVIEKLRKDNKQLAATTVNMSVNALSGAGMEEEGRQLDVMRKKHAAEMSDLRQKLVWYAENQELLEDLENEKESLLHAVKLLKDELRRKGLSVPVLDLGSGVHAMAERRGKEDRDVTPQSNGRTAAARYGPKGTGISTGQGPGFEGAAPKPKYMRHPGDVKKIKELEVLLSDVQESMRKRNPDSVSNLIRAATESDEVLAERKMLSQLALEAKAELAAVKSQYEVRLRSLRQEHEKLKVQYEARAALKLEGSKEGYTGRKLVTSAIRTLPNAMIKIRELEDEIVKVRTFYTRKVEEAQRKGEMQLRALKRGDTTTALTDGGRTAAADESVICDQVEELQGDVQGASQDNTPDLKSREEELIVLRSELAVTKQELATLRSAPASVRTLDQSPLSAVNYETLRAAESELLKLQYMRESESRMQRERAKWQEMAEDRAMKDERAEAERREMRNQRDELKTRLQEEESKTTRQASEIWRLNSLLDGPKTPQMQQFLAMETHLRALESRADRRERELRAAVEHVTSTSKIESARLQAVHRQECSEKDEQLARFQGELERLVHALRQWQATAEVSVRIDKQDRGPE